MPVFEYEALAPDGVRKSGVMDAESEAAVRERLRSGNHYPVSIVLTQGDQGAGRARISSLLAYSRISRTEIHVFTRQLATLIGAGMPLDEALAAIAGQIENQTLKQVVVQLKEAVGEGASLSTALQERPQLFSSMYVNMVRAGEAFGSLDLVLSRLADFGDRFDEVRGRFRAAMIYPAFMTVVGAGVLFILITFVVPDIMQVYAKMEQALPLPTRLLIGLGAFFRGYWWLLLVLGIIGAVALKMFFSTTAGRKRRDRALLTMPVFGNVAKKNVFYHTCQTNPKKYL